MGLQFCINYANEKLHQLFNKHIFEAELAVYAGDGVDVVGQARRPAPMQRTTRYVPCNAQRMRAAAD